MAGVPGFEPGLSVLETDVLTVDTIPLRGYCQFADFQLPILQPPASLPKIGNRQLAIFIWSLYDLCAYGNGDRIC
jgi:hypothetical protein